MFRQGGTVALLPLMTFGSLALVIAISGCSNKVGLSKPDAGTANLALAVRHPLLGKRRLRHSRLNLYRGILPWTWVMPRRWRWS